MDTAPPTDTTDNVWKRIRIRERDRGSREGRRGMDGLSGDRKPILRDNIGLFYVKNMFFANMYRISKRM